MHASQDHNSKVEKCKTASFLLSFFFMLLVFYGCVGNSNLMQSQIYKNVIFLLSSNLYNMYHRSESEA